MLWEENAVFKTYFYIMKCILLCELEFTNLFACHNFPFSAIMVQGYQL